MLQLTRHELFKLFRNRGIWAGMLICMIVYGLYAYSAAPSSFNNYHKVYRYYKVGEGTVTKEDIQIAKEGMVRLDKKHDKGIKFNDKELGERLLYLDIKEVVSEQNRHNKLIKELMGSNDRKQQLQYKMLNKAGPLEAAYYTLGWKEILAFWGNIGYYLVVIMGIFAVSRIYPEERAVGMDALLVSMMEGRRKLVMAKITAAIVFIISLSITFELINLVTNAYFYGLAGWNAPLKNVLLETPYGLLVWQFWMLKLLLAIVSVASVCLLSMLISFVVKNSMVAFVTGGLVFLIYDSATKDTLIVGIHGLSQFLTIDCLRLRGFCTSYLNISALNGLAITFEQVQVIVSILLLLTVVLITYKTGKKSK